MIAHRQPLKKPAARLAPSPRPRDNRNPQRVRQISIVAGVYAAIGGFVAAMIAAPLGWFVMPVTVGMFVGAVIGAWLER